jgi:predicted PurR-regulated permease PerM
MNGGAEFRRRAGWIAYGLTVGASILLVAMTFAPLWEPLLLAAVLASITHGWYVRLGRGLGGRPRLAGAIMTIAVILLVLIPFGALISLLLRQALEAIEYVRAALAEGGVAELVGRLPESIERRVLDLTESLPAGSDSLSEQATAGGWTVARIFGDLLAGLTRAIFGLVMMLIAYYALLLEGPRLMRWLRTISPLEDHRTGELFAEFRQVGRSVVGSTLISAAAQAGLAAVGYLIAGVPNPVFFAFLTLLVALIPAIGTPLVTLPLAALLLANGQIWQGIFLAAYGILVVSTIDNIIKPLVVRGGTALSGTMVFFALIGGLLAFGAIGLVLGPLTVTFFLAMVRFTQQRDPEPKAPGPAASGAAAP